MSEQFVPASFGRGPGWTFCCADCGYGSEVAPCQRCAFFADYARIGIFPNPDPRWFTLQRARNGMLTERVETK